MKILLKLSAVLLLGSTILVAECTSEKKAQMIMNGVEQSVIDKICSDEGQVDDDKQVQVIINNNNTNENDNNNASDNSSSNGIERDRLYISGSYSKMSGMNTFEYYDAFSYYDGEYEFDLDASGYAFAIGYVFNNNNRLEISFTKTTINETQSISTYDEESTITSLDLNYIWMLGSNNVDSGDFRPFILLGIGSNTLVSETPNNLLYQNGFDYPEAEDFKGAGINMGIGVNFSPTESIELDLGYYYKVIVWKEQAFDYDYYNNYYYGTYTDTINLNTVLKGFTATARLKF